MPPENPAFIAKLNTLSPGVTSPFVPSSKKLCGAEPPIGDRSAATAMPVLAGIAPGVTLTVSRMGSPGFGLFGLDAPEPVGFVVVGAQGAAVEAVFRAA